MRSGQEKMDANQVKADASMKTHRQEIIAKIHANQEKTMAESRAWQKKIQAKAEASRKIKSGQAEMRSTVNAFGDKMGALIAGMKDGQTEIMACQEMMEAHLECKEPSLKEMEFGAENQEVPKEHAVVRSSGIRKKLQRGRHVAAG
jgi:hypothetical protein